MLILAALYHCWLYSLSPSSRNVGVLWLKCKSVKERAWIQCFNVLNQNTFIYKHSQKVSDTLLWVSEIKVLFKGAIVDLWPFGGSAAICKHNIPPEIVSSVLANSCLLQIQSIVSIHSIPFSYHFGGHRLPETSLAFSLLNVPLCSPAGW